MRTGRPTDYTPELTDIICERLALGESMRSVCRDPAMPAMTTLFRWLREKQDFKQQYDTAKRESADAHVDDMLDIADNDVYQQLIIDGVPQFDANGDPVMYKDAVSVNHAKLRVETRKWCAIKLNRRKFGDTLTNVNLNHDMSEMSDEELDRLLAERESAADRSSKD